MDCRLDYKSTIFSRYHCKTKYPSTGDIIKRVHQYVTRSECEEVEEVMTFTSRRVRILARRWRSRKDVRICMWVKILASRWGSHKDVRLSMRSEDTHEKVRIPFSQGREYQCEKW